MTIHASPQLNNLLFVLIGEKMLQADEDMAYANGKPYERLGRRVRDLSDLIEQTAGGVGRALPPQVGNNYVRAMHMFLDSGGVNYLKEFADQLDSIGQSRTKSSMDIMESKWQIIAELIRLLIELMIIAVLSAFTGGSAASQAAVAKARSRVAILTLLEWLMKKTHLMPSLTEAIEEAFTTFAVRLAMMLGAPKGRRPNGFDWSQIVQDGVFGAFTGLFHGLLSDLGKGLKNKFKNIFDTHNPFKDISGNGGKFNHKFDNPDLHNKPNPKPTPTPDPKTTPTPMPSPHLTPTPTPTPKPKSLGDKVKHEIGEDIEHFLAEGGAETLGEIATASVFGFPIDPLNTFLGSGLSSMSERHLGQGAGALGNKFNFTAPPPVNTLSTTDIPDDGTSSTNDPSHSSPTGDNTTTTGLGPVNTASNKGSSSTNSTPHRTSSTITPPTRSTGADDVQVDGGDLQSNVPHGTTSSTHHTGTTGSGSSSNTPTRTPDRTGTNDDPRTQQPEQTSQGDSGNTTASGTPAPVRTVQQQPHSSGGGESAEESAQGSGQPDGIPDGSAPAPASSIPDGSIPAPASNIPVTSLPDTTVVPPGGTSNGSPASGSGSPSNTGGSPDTGPAPVRTVQQQPHSSGGGESAEESAQGSGQPDGITDGSTPAPARNIPVTSVPDTTVVPPNTAGSGSGSPSTAGGNPRATASGHPQGTTSDSRATNGPDTTQTTDTEGDGSSRPESGTDTGPDRASTPADTDLPTPVATTSNNTPPATSSAPDTAPRPHPGSPAPEPASVVLTPSVTPESGGFAETRAGVTASERSTTWADPVSRPLGTDGRPTQYVVRAGFAVRRFTHDGVPVTDLTVTYRLTGSPHLGPQADGVHRRLTDGVRRVFNTPGHRLRDGSLLHVTVVPAAPGETPHLDVTLTDPADGIGATHHSWPADISDSDLAHEVGHQLGLRDESGLDPAAPHRGGTASLMGDPTRPAPPTEPTDPPYQPGGLRPRHLDLIGSIVDTPAVARRGASPGGPGADPPAPPVTETETETVPAVVPVVPVLTVTSPEGHTTPPPEPESDGGRRTSYLGGYGRRHDGQVGLVHVEPFPPDVVDGVHRQVLAALGRPTPRPDDPVHAQLRDVLSAEQMVMNLPYLRSRGGHRITLDADGVQRHVDVRLTLDDARPSARQGDIDTSDPDKHVERRGQGTREIVSAQPSGTFSTIPVPWTGTIPIAAAGPVRGVDLGLSATLTHNQADGSTTVTQVVQTTSAQRSNEPSRAYDFTGNWEVRLDAPAPGQATAPAAITDAADTAVDTTPPDPAVDWRPAQPHGPVTIWFPQHLVDADADPGQELPTPARLDDLPVYGVDSVLNPRRLYEGAADHFSADLDATSSSQLADFLAEPILRGTLPMQREGGLYSPVLTDAHGRAVGIMRLDAQVTPTTPVAKSIDKKINLESHLVNSVKNDQNTSFNSGVTISGSAGPAFTHDPRPGHPDASRTVGGTLTVKGTASLAAQNVFGTSSVAGTMHAVRTNRSHLLTEADVTYTLTLTRPDGSTETYAPGTWRHGLDLRMLSAEDARGHVPAEDEIRALPHELATLESVGQSTAPLGVDGADPLFAEAETWLRDHGFLPPPADAPRRSRLPDETLVQAQLNNLRRLHELRSQLGLRAATDSMVDGGHSLYLEIPSVTGRRRVRLELGAQRDADLPVQHLRVLPDIQVMGLAQAAGGGTGRLGNTYGLGAGFGGGLSVPTPHGAWTLNATGDYQYVGQAALGNTTATTLGHDQFFIGTGQNTEEFGVPARLTLDLYEGPGQEPLVRFGEPEPEPRAEDDLEAGPPVIGPRGVPGTVRLAVPHERTLTAEEPAPEGEPYTVRQVAPLDTERLAMTDPAAGEPHPDVVRVPDDALIDVVRGSAALQDAFRRIVTGAGAGDGTGTHVETTEDASAAGTATPAPPGRFSRLLGGATGFLSSSLVGSPSTDTTTVSAEARITALSPGSLVGRGHQILGGTYVVEGLILPGLGADGQLAIEIQAVAHTPRLTHSVNQYLETGISVADSAQQLKGLGKTHQFGLAGSATQNNPPTPTAVSGQPAGSPAPTPSPSRFNPSGRYQYDRKSDKSDTLTAVTATNRVPTQSGRQHRITADVTYLITVRSGHRNVLANSFGFGPAQTVTLAVDVPRGLQFLMTDSQLRREGRWMGAVAGRPDDPSTTGLESPPLPSRYVRDGTLGLAAVNSVTELAGLGNGTGPATGSATPQIEQRGRLHDEVRQLVDRYAPGVTTPGHASYLPGVAALIADNTGVAGKRALIGRGGGQTRFSFRHHRFGGAALVEVTFSARPTTTAASRGALRGTAVPGDKSGIEQWGSHTAEGRSASTSSGRQHRLTVNPTARFSRPDTDDRTDRTGPSLQLVSATSKVDKKGRTAEDRFWLRTDSAADFDGLDYELVATVRSTLVADWPPNVVGALVQRGIIAWDDADASTRSWLSRTLSGELGGQARVPALVSLRFTGSETDTPGDGLPQLAPSVSRVDPRTLTTGPSALRDTDLFHPTGNAPVYGFNAWDQLYTALDQVAPATGSGWRSQPASTSDEHASVRLGELIQAGTISLDTPRQVGGMLPTMPGAFPLQGVPDQRPTLTVSLYRPRAVTDGGDVAMDRLRITSDSSSTVSGGDTTTGLALPFVLSADDPDRNLLGATPPLLQRPVDASNFGSGVSGGRRDWLKTGSTSMPAEGRGTRSYEIQADVHITVSGPEGVRHVTGTATVRVEERDALGHGITEPRPVPRVYDLPALLAEQTGAAPADWATTPLREVPAALTAGVDPEDDGYQFWVATGPDPDGSRLSLALYGASRTARAQGHPVELVTRGPEGLRVWSFDPDGTLTSPPAATPGPDGGTVSGSTTGDPALDRAWADFETTAAEFDRAESDHTEALVDEHGLRDLRPDAQDSVDGAAIALADATAEAHRTDTAATTAEQAADRAEADLRALTERVDTLVGRISVTRRTIGPLTDAIAEGERQEIRLSARTKEARRHLTELTDRAAAAATRPSGSADTTSVPTPGTSDATSVPTPGTSDATSVPTPGTSDATSVPTPGTS
ncbi:hypothetical protein AB0D87_41065, partial [Streptomyces sp. NPDC048342]